MAFQLDTSGYVQCPAPDQRPNETTGCWFWSDLSPFTQGYIEALFESAGRKTYDGCIGAKSTKVRSLAFRDLAPETLSRIIADCEAADKGRPDPGENGSAFWRVRNHPMMPPGEWVNRFPPLTVQLGDDGKVRFAEPAEQAA